MQLSDGRELPVGAGAMPVCGFDADGNPVSAATEATASSLKSSAFGLNGSTYISGTSAVTGTFVAIQALADTVVSTMTSTDIAGTLTSVPIPAGVTIYGTITSITLTSGKVIAYNK